LRPMSRPFAFQPTVKRVHDASARRLSLKAQAILRGAYQHIADTTPEETNLATCEANKAADAAVAILDAATRRVMAAERAAHDLASR
jgi:hypothetical protein